MKDLKTVIESEVLDLFATEQTMREVESELQTNPTFLKFLELQKAVNDKAAEVWKAVGNQMIDAYKAGKVDKTLKFDFGTLTVKDINELDIDENLLPRNYFKRVPHTTKIRNDYALEGKLPKGVTVTKKYQFSKSLKKVGE
jgi:hypothetical protein